MKGIYSICLLFCLFGSSYGQYNILYDLDTYLRVDINLRTTFVSPDAFVGYDNVVNSPGSDKLYFINLSGNYTDNWLRNSEAMQTESFTDASVLFSSGTSQRITTDFVHQQENRLYKDNKYVNYGFNVNSEMEYSDAPNFVGAYEKTLRAGFDFGFGFGRLEVINNAWIGARILEELNKGSLLITAPASVGMKAFFDLIGEVENERVMDPRLSDLYQIEKIIEFIQDQNWIEKGSITAFAIIYDAFRYEDFFIRRSGERLEFMMKPYIGGRYNWIENGVFKTNNHLQPGFEACIEYESHTNGDLKYYVSKTVGALLHHYEFIRKGASNFRRFVDASMFYRYQYRYIPSLRTNLLVDASISGGFFYSEVGAFNPRINLNAALVYNYYFSPSTQLEMRSDVRYFDPEFQSGDFQPVVRFRFSVNILHAIR